MTSAGADEGKSEAIACLGIAFAQAGMRVVIVDADLRRPAQHLRFNLPNSDGLSNLFGGATPRTPTLQPTAVPNLHVLTSGTEPESPADILASSDLDRIMDHAGRDADLVLIDCPPICAVADASVLSTRVDGVIVVVGAGVVKRDLARHARAQLDAVRANVIGLVVTNAPYNERTFASYYEESPGRSAS
jgi:capsular exopolysaccharide synthesis family protein